MTDKQDHAVSIEYEAQWSIDRKKILAALFKFQHEIGTIKRTQSATIRLEKTGGEYRYKFSDLNDTLDTVLPVLLKCGLYIDWGSEPSRMASGTLVTCTVFETEDWQWKSVTLPAFHEGSSQKMGGALSYVRRYATQVLLGLRAEDPDANIEGQALQAIQKLKDAMVPEFLDALAENDHKGIRILADSLQTWEYKSIWDEFNTKQKSHITEMIQRARIEAGDSEPLDEVDQKRADRMRKERSET